MNSKSQLEKENIKLKEQMLIAKAAIEDYREELNKLTEKELFGRLSMRVTKLEFDDRKQRIHTIINGLYKEEELDDRIDSFAKSGLPIEEIEEIVKPLRKKK